MPIDRTACPEFLNDYILYLSMSKSLSPRTVEEYYLDIRLFLQYILMMKDKQYRVEMNHKTRPVVVSIETTETDFYKKKHYASIMEHDRELAKLDQELAEYMQDYTAGR